MSLPGVTEVVSELSKFKCSADNVRGIETPAPVSASRFVCLIGELVFSFDKHMRIFAYVGEKRKAKLNGKMLAKCGRGVGGRENDGSVSRHVSVLCVCKYRVALFKRKL